MADVRRARRLLLNLRERLLCRVAQLDGGLISGDLADQANAFTTRHESEVDGERVRARVRDIDDAIRRVDAGQYGVCASCGEDILPKRLEAVPEARYCVACAEALERRGPDRAPAPYPADEDC